MVNKLQVFVNKCLYRILWPEKNDEGRSTETDWPTTIVVRVKETIWEMDWSYTQGERPQYSQSGLGMKLEGEAEERTTFFRIGGKNVWKS